MEANADDTPRRRVGRPIKYDWGDKRDICYKLYVEDKLSTPQISKYFCERLSVDPSELPCRRGFLRQFQLWGFPPHTRQFSPEEQSVIQARIRELWEQNVCQKDIKAMLATEGWELKDTEFNRLWKKNGLRLRIRKGYKPPDNRTNKRGRSASALDETLNADVDGPLEEHGDDIDALLAAPLGPEEAAARAQRLFEIQAESDQRLQTRKRRRRIRGFGHLPPDAPGTAPRYNSETSLDECKAYLHLSNEMYQTIRKDYEAICQEMGILKKTQCAEGGWEESKRKLIRENMHLSAMMHPLQPEQEKKAVALDCVCTDVTKRMRVAGRSITIAEANNLLALNPMESKALRRTMYETLAADNFESRLVCGDEHWKELRQQWYDSNHKLQEWINENDSKKLKAIDLLCSDAVKRFREDKNKRGERVVVQKNAKYGPGPGPAWSPIVARSKREAREKASQNAGSEDIPTQESRARATVQDHGYPRQDPGGFISTLAQAASNIDFELLDPALSAAGAFVSQPQQSAAPIPAYFRLSAGSNVIGSHPRMWLGRLPSATIPSLHQAALSKAGASTVAKVYGVVKNQDSSEDSWLIETQDELQVYLSEAGEKATFVVTLQGGYA